ncbi:hypothetical protein SCHPADRAFT_887116 [Schizopora paradoxa]|uniref:Uncharacterized protein n=1 Tax=Schizopora paradoxa TaxID=27342 RepID=A0A0H2S0A9_9AGAM|nr:hypothetical protein SCHPADRAFT_887116 [Schizopora paradoxa]
MSTHRLLFFWGRRRRRRRLSKFIELTDLTLLTNSSKMSSQQLSDLQYAQFQAFFAAQNAGSQLNFGGGSRSVEHVEGARHGLPFGVARPPPSTVDTVDYILRIVAQADQGMLLRSGNEAFATLSQSHKGTLEELAALKRAFDVLVRTQSSTSIPTNECLDVRTQSSPSIPTNESLEGSPSPPQNTDAAPAVGNRLRPTGIPRRIAYSKDDVPHIKYFTRTEYDAAKAKWSANLIRPADGDSRLSFMEHEDGTPISEQEAKQLRQSARGIFAHLLSQRQAPEKWGQVSVVAQDFFFNTIAERFPYAAMGEDMWKMQLLATICYPSWYRNNKDKVDQNRRDPINQQLEYGRQLKEELIEHVELSVKRSRPADENVDGSETQASKKTRTGGNRTNIEARPRTSSSTTTQTRTSSSTTTQTLSSASRLTSTSKSVTTAGLSSSRDNGSTVSQPIQDVHNSRTTSSSSSTPGNTVPPPSNNNYTLYDRRGSPASSEGTVSTIRDPSPSLTNAPIDPPVDANQTVNDHQGSSASSEGIESATRDLPSSSSERPNAAGHEKQASAPPPPPTPSPSVDSWAYDTSGLDTTNAQEVALDRLSIHDSTPYLPTSYDEQQPSLDSMPSPAPFESATLGIQSQMEGDNEEMQLPPHNSMPSPSPDSRQVSAEASLNSFYTPGDSQTITTETRDSRDSSADTSPESSGERALGRIRPTSENPHPYGGTKKALDFESTFVKEVPAKPLVIRNPLADLVKERVPSSNVLPDTLESVHSQDSSEKENVSVKSKGRGRPPAGKAVDPEQIIKGTPASCTTRNLFALEYKSKNGKNPTEALWQSLSKAELERFEQLSKEKKALSKEQKAAKTKSKAEAK